VNEVGTGLYGLGIEVPYATIHDQLLLPEHFLQVPATQVPEELFTGGTSSHHRIINAASSIFK
jgi:hypothetical protein